MEPLFLIGVGSFSIQQLVEIVADPVTTYYVRRAIAHRTALGTLGTIRGFTEQACRRIANGAWSTLLGVFVALFFTKVRILAAYEGGPVSMSGSYRLLDILLSGLVLGAGTNGANSVIKLAQY